MDPTSREPQLPSMWVVLEIRVPFRVLFIRVPYFWDLARGHVGTCNDQFRVRGSIPTALMKAAATRRRGK